MCGCVVICGGRGFPECVCGKALPYLHECNFNLAGRGVVVSPSLNLYIVFHL